MSTYFSLYSIVDFPQTKHLDDIKEYLLNNSDDVSVSINNSAT